MSKATLILRVARRLIDEIGWTQGAFARTRHGNPIGPEQPNAACFCAAGAVRRAAHEVGAGARLEEWSKAFLALEAVSQNSVVVTLQKLKGADVGDGIAEFNDYPGQVKECVLHLFDRAIEVCQ